MSDELIKRLRTSWDTQRSIMLQTDAWMSERHLAADRIEALTAERDEAYARGYNDAETEINKSALGQKVAFLNDEYSNAVHRIKDLNELLDEAQTEWSNYSSAWMTAEGKLADAEDFIEHLLKLLAEAASDLTAYVDAEYPPDTCDRYPDIANRRERDMELVRRIEVALKGESRD
jgi:chromosome segregation ATPase